MSYELLSEPIRRFVRDKRWSELRPIQHAAIKRILASDENYILASRTASGKTEAAFLPILSKVDFGAEGVQVLYISPLIALINDQFFRVEELCGYLDVPVTKWHGEASRGAKNRLLLKPEGIVLITPESLEAMFVNKPQHIAHLFRSLRYVVIDEIHSFLGSDRGIQLKSLLARLQKVNRGSFSVVALSATIGDYAEAKRFTGNEAKTKVLLDKTSKEIEVAFRYFEGTTEELPVDLIDDLYRETAENKVLLFPNSRGRAEEVAVRLKKKSAKEGGHPNYFSHHSSVDKEVREYVEAFAKSNQRQNFLISCTSTLELGIDIGTVDEVVQIDATHSIASLIQRVGRSGRRDGEKSYLYLYATKPWSLLQSLACWTLYQEGFIEPPLVVDKPYDLLLHQALSITKGCSGIQLSQLLDQLHHNFAFQLVEKEDIEMIVNHLISIDFLEKLGGEVIIGVAGEKVVNSREFYSVFKTEEVFKVINAGNTIGELPFSPQIRENENILLSARIWKITGVDMEAKKILVIRANDGKKPVFGGSGATIHPRIREQMLKVICSDEQFEYLNEIAKSKIEELRNEFIPFKITNTAAERPLLVSDVGIELFTFSGTRINRTLQYLLELTGLKSQVEESCSSIEVDCTSQELFEKWETMRQRIDNVEGDLQILLTNKPVLLAFSKWGAFLPMKYQVLLLRDRYFDFPGTAAFLDTMILKSNR